MKKDRAMLDMMFKYGGSFIQALAQCMELADSNNYTKLVCAFPKYISEYREMAKKELLKDKKE